jgi:Tumour-associated protein
MYNIHARMSTFILRRTSSRFRSCLEQLILVFTLCGFALLFISHVSFVYRGSFPSFFADASVANQCLARFPISSANLTHIVLAAEGQRTSVAFQLEPDMCLTHNILFSYSKTRGFLLINHDDAWRHQISTQYISIHPQDPLCFGEPFLQSISQTLLGKDTIVLNWLLSLQTGYIYNSRTNQIFHLDPTKSLPHLSLFRLPFNFHHLWIKSGVVVMSIFLFFITTTLVSFTLRTTQERMLEFTIQLQAHVRQELPLGILITTHVLENLVFVPIMLGMMFFLIELYGGDSLLAFLVMSVVWLSEVFTVLTLRSREGMKFFPRVFFLLFFVFHVYHFSCPYGFTYTSLGVTVSFMVHSMWFFWNRYELPAVAHGLVSIERPRMYDIYLSTSLDVRSIPPVDQTAEAGQVVLAPRNLGRDYPSVSSFGRASIMSQQPSSSGFIHDEDGDDEGSYMYFMNGEVVIHRTRSPGLSENAEQPLGRNTSLHSLNSPLDEARTMPVDDATPRMRSHPERYGVDLVDSAPRFPLF